MTWRASFAFSFQNSVATITPSTGKLPDSQVVFHIFPTSGNTVQLTDECDLLKETLKRWGGRGLRLAQLSISNIAGFKFSLQSSQQIVCKHFSVCTYKCFFKYLASAREFLLDCESRMPVYVPKHPKVYRSKVVWFKWTPVFKFSSFFWNVFCTTFRYNWN